jgi:hypothetical protein
MKVTSVFIKYLNYACKISWIEFLITLCLVKNSIQISKRKHSVTSRFIWEAILELVSHRDIQTLENNVWKHCFLVFGYPGETLALVVHILHENFHAQIEFFRKILNQNGYPTRLFDRCVRVFLDKAFQPKELIHSVSRKVVYFCLPYTATHSPNPYPNSKPLLCIAFPHISISVFRPTVRLSNFFMFKDKIPDALRSCVVYYFKCRC